MIDNPKKWRLSMSGFSIKSGWGNEKKFIARYTGTAYPLNADEFQEWIENATDICSLHNKELDNNDEQE